MDSKWYFRLEATFNDKWKTDPPWLIVAYASPMPSEYILKKEWEKPEPDIHPFYHIRKQFIGKQRIYDKNYEKIIGYKKIEPYLIDGLFNTHWHTQDSPVARAIIELLQNEEFIKDSVVTGTDMEDNWTMERARLIRLLNNYSMM